MSDFHKILFASKQMLCLIHRVVKLHILISSAEERMTLLNMGMQTCLDILECRMSLSWIPPRCRARHSPPPPG